MKRPSILCKKCLRLAVFLLFFVLFLGGLLPLLYGVLNYGNLFLLLISIAGMVCTLCFPRLSRFLRMFWSCSVVGKVLLSALCLLLSGGILYFCGLSIRMSVAAAKTPPEEALPVIVLGGQIDDDQPAPILRNRLEVALTYLQSHPTAPCIVTGGQGIDEEYTEAYVMKLWLTEHGIAEDRIFTENFATNTAENLTFSSEILAEHQFGTRVIIATDSWHQLRGQLWAETLGLQAYSLPCSTPWKYLLTFHVRETLALTRFFLFGY